MNRVLSGRSSTCSRLAGSVKLGQPVPESNLVPELNSSVPQPTHLYMPVPFSFTKGPVKARSVPPRRVTSYCSGVSSWRHSSSLFTTFVAIASSLLSSVGPSVRRPSYELVTTVEINRDEQTDLLFSSHRRDLADLRLRGERE